MYHVSDPPGRTVGRHRVRRTIRRVVLFLVIFLVVEYLVLPQLAGARRAIHLVAHVNLALVGLALVLEAASLLAYAQLTRSVLPPESTPALSRVAKIDLSTLAVSHLVPGGSAAGAGVGFHLLEEAGVESSDAGFALATQGLGSAIVLNVLLWVALVVSIPLHGFNPMYVTTAAVGALLIGAFSVLVLLLTRGEARAARIFRAVARHTPFLREDAVHQMVHRIAGRLRALASNRRLLLSAIGWAAANWILDAACLWVFIAAFGRTAPIDGLLVSYGLANVLAAIPVTPGGLGVVEAVLTASLLGFGVPRGVAILGVVGYRLVNFWLPIPAGGLAYLSLRLGRRGLPREIKREKLRELADQALKGAEDPREWAARHGVAIPASSREPAAPEQDREAESDEG